MNKEQEKRWQHLDRLQKAFMADHITKEDYFSQPENEQMKYYEWLQSQSSMSCWM